MVSSKGCRQETILVSMLDGDDGDWLRPLLARVREETKSQPDSLAVARMREAVLCGIERDVVPLVA
ncbi:MAG: hypothetical protein ABSG55_06440 [Dehalococcoidia bacterium]|jgi:hypothetical protein